MAKDTKSSCNVTIDVNIPEGKCIPQEMVIRNVKLAAAYVPFQQLCSLLSPMEALKHGTAFPELYSPYDEKEKKYKTVCKK